MNANRKAFQTTPVFYYPFVETRPKSGKGLLAALSHIACVVVTDDYPGFFLPRMITAAARISSVRMEKLDSNGIVPLRAGDRIFTTAHSFRRWMQHRIIAFLHDAPNADPLATAGSFPDAAPPPNDILSQWPPAPPVYLDAAPDFLATLPIDHTVKPVTLQGGYVAAQDILNGFLPSLTTYHQTRQHPDMDATSHLSPYLHFGFIASHDILNRILQQENGAPDRFGKHITGSASGFWGIGDGAEAFLDELIVWREIGFNWTFLADGDDRYGALPQWALKTLASHAADPRPYNYSLEDFENAATHDPLWNAAQRQLLHEGRIHNYLRMLWGKKILHWSKSPETALSIMMELNNRYALDGRDPNSLSGIFWVLGRYDRAWGPRRPVFGTVRYMSSRRTLKKVRVRDYLQKYAEHL